MSKRSTEFEIVNHEFIIDNNFCLGEKLIPNVECMGVMTTHHAKGRKGELLTDKKYFRRLCWAHHKWVHNNKEQAIELGLSFPIPRK